MAEKQTRNKECKANFIKVMDQLLWEKKSYISSQEVLERYLAEYGDKSGKYQSHKPSDYDGLTKAKKAIRDCLLKRGLDFETSQGDDGRTEFFKYPDNVPDDLLSSLKKETKLFRQQALLDLAVRQSRGLFPSSWLAKFRIQAEEEICKNKIGCMPIVEFDANERLMNQHLLPMFYFAIRDKEVVRFRYAPFDKAERIWTFHPHYLKEYNLRWFVFGLAIDADGKRYEVQNCALDRIVGRIEKLKGEKYILPTVDYATYFDDIVGVTRIKGKSKIRIEIQTKDLYTHRRIMTKPLHKSQKEVQPFDEGTHRGIISLEVIPNRELLGLLMSFESHIEILSPLGYRKKMQAEIRNMYDLYK